MHRFDVTPFGRSLDARVRRYGQPIFIPVVPMVISVTYIDRKGNEVSLAGDAEHVAQILRKAGFCCRFSSRRQDGAL